MIKFILAFSILVAIAAFLLSSNENHSYKEIITAAMLSYGSIVDIFLKSEPHIFTISELNKYDGSENSLGLCLAVLGRVYDVSQGKRHYGPGGGYSFFSGKDGSKAFVTGDFSEKGLIDDVSELSNIQLLDLQDWIDTYETKYIFIGFLEGTYYDSKGKPTSKLLDVQRRMEEGKKEKESEADDKRMYPSCNSHWSQADGTTVWCSSKSGGIDRGWVGVPRRYHQPGKTVQRCACIRTEGPPGNQPDSKSNRGDLDDAKFKVYEDCDPLSPTCKLIS